MKFSEVVAQTLAWLQREGRVSYRAVKREFDLDDEFLEDLKTELIDAKRVAVDENGKVLVWTGEGINGETDKQEKSEDSLESRVQSLESTGQGRASTVQTLDPRRQTLDAAAERRQLTVMFCDLVGSTALSTQLDPEELREVVQQYQQACADVIQRHEGYIAQYLGDGLLVYFGYPTAHEDDARRAVRTGLDVIAELPRLNDQLQASVGAWRRRTPTDLATTPLLQVRIGIHTGLVVVGEIGSKEKRELLALGETPNIAARIQGLAEPNTVIISAATQRLVEGQFESQPFGSHLVKGIDTPIAVYHIQSERQSASPLARKTSLTPLVGREQEVGLLIDRWEQVKEGRGQVVLLSGEPGIGKSRLIHTLNAHVSQIGSLLFEARCSPYHQHSALYPLIEVLQRTFLLNRQDTDSEKVAKLERALALYNMQDSLPLFTALLSLPSPSQYPPLNLTPQKQKERTLQALVQLLIAQAERQATVSVWEDLHWADPSSLEFLSLLIEQIPTTKLLLVLTFRPEFTPPWKSRSHISQLVLNRLGKKHVEVMIEKVMAGKELSAEVIDQIRVKADGVPLFVEELTKNVLESVESIGSIESPHHAPHQLAIPATLQEALLARLDRLSSARQIAQLGAMLGREFSYELLHAVALLSEIDLQSALVKLVEAEILYQRGVDQQTRYFFKHALIQDTAYQSLLKSTRQQYHRQIAHVLDGQFPEAKDSQPELIAHHYTEAGLAEQAIPYWQQAGQNAIQRSAHAEAITHFQSALALLQTLPDSVERAQQEIPVQAMLGISLMATKGWAVPEVEEAYSRAHVLCRRVGETPQLFPVLWGLWAFYVVREQLQTAREVAEQCVRLAQSVHDPMLLVGGHYALGTVLVWLGEFVLACSHLEQGYSFYEAPQHRSHVVLYGVNLGMGCQMYMAYALWGLGYPEQALEKIDEAIRLAQEVAHPDSQAWALVQASATHRFRGEAQLAQQQAEKVLAFSKEQGLALQSILATIFRGGALVQQGQEEEGVSQIQQGVATWRAMKSELGTAWQLGMLAEGYTKMGQLKAGLASVAEALRIVERNGEHFYEAELYRLKGELTLQQSKFQGPKSELPSTQAEAEAEACFLKAIDIARKQQAKSLELRAVMSLVRLRQRQVTNHEPRNTEHASRSALAEAHKLLSDIYNWFTEGFDTKDLQEAKTLLDSLASNI